MKGNSSSKSERCFENETVVNVGLDSVVSMATCYGLDSPGIESRLGARFSVSSGLAAGPTQPPVQTVPGFFSGVKRPGRGVDHPPLSERRYLYFPPGLSWPLLGWTLPDSVEPALDEWIIFWSLNNPSLVEWIPNVAILRIRELEISFIPFFAKGMLFCYAKISMMEPVKRSRYNWAAGQAAEDSQQK